MCACLSNGLCRVRAQPRAVEAQGLLRSRAGSPGGGQPGFSGNKKGTSPLRRGAWLAILKRIQSELTLTGWLFGVRLSTVGPCLAGQFHLSGFTYTTIVMFCLSSVIAPAQGGVKCRLPGMSEYWRFDQRPCASRRLWWGSFGGLCIPWMAEAESSAGEMRGRSGVLALDLCEEPGLECDCMTRPPGSGCGTSRRARRACRLVGRLKDSFQEETEAR